MVRTWHTGADIHSPLRRRSAVSGGACPTQSLLSAPAGAGEFHEAHAKRLAIE